MTPIYGNDKDGKKKMDFSLETRERKTSVLKKGTFGCLTGIPSVNITMGCSLGCVYCYARGYPGAPGKGRVILFSNLAGKLRQELKRKRERVNLVLFNTASDSFQPHPDIIKTSTEVMEILLSRGIKITFLTKGVIPRRFLDMAIDYCKLVSARIGMVSLSEEYQRRFEPYAATPAERLKNIESLQKIGIVPEVRIDPIVPFVTDSQDDFDTLFKELKALGVMRGSMSYLHLRPAIEDQLEMELDALNLRLVKGLFAGGNWRTVGSSTRSKLVPRGLREKGYERAKEAAQKYGLELTICSCKNPDMMGEFCTPELIDLRDKADKGEKPDRQLSLSFVD